MGTHKIRRPFVALSSGEVKETLKASSNVTLTKTVTQSSNATVAGTLGVTGVFSHTAAQDAATIQALTGSTGTASTINYAPVTTLTATSAATSYTMPAPKAGYLKEIYCITATTTNTCVVQFAGTTGSTGYFFRSATGAAATQRKITFNASNEGVILRGGSSAAAGYWIVASAINSPSFGTT